MSQLRVFLFLLFAAAVPSAASAAGDIYLEIPAASADGTVAAPQRVDILSWSWGVSNGGTSSSGGGKGVGKVSVDDNNGDMTAGRKAKGKVNMQDMSVSMHGSAPADGSVGKVNVQDISITKYGRAPADGSAFTAMMGFDPASEAAVERFGRTCSCPVGARECPSGKHFDKVVIVLSGKRYQLSDVSMDCVADSGRRARELRGHVTLIK